MQFWLGVHRGFRDLGELLRVATLDFRSGQVTPDRFRQWFVPRLGHLLSHLHAHHQIEDFEYFPLLAAAERRLARGFDVLEKDHEIIHATISALTEAAQGFLRVAAGDRDRLLSAGDRYADASDRLIVQLMRHLDDEEDLVVPLVLDRGEEPLGISWAEHLRRMQEG
jgi:hemerythrin-like domain-containing protein